MKLLTSPPNPDPIGGPIWFAECALRQPLYPWQDWCVAPLEDPRKRVKTTCVAPNGSGKSERVIALSALFVIFSYLKGKVVITTADGKQLDNQIWPAIKKHASSFPNFKFTDRRVDTPTGGFCVAFTTDEEGRAEGWHKEMGADLLDGPLLIIVDEAKTVPEAIFNAIKLRCNFTWLLLISSAGYRMGSFYDSHLDPTFRKRTVTHLDCPHLDQERVSDLLKLGRDHPIVASTLFSEFMNQDDSANYFLTLEEFDRCVQNPTVHKRGDISAFEDFASGGAENVLAYRNGNKVTIPAAWVDRNTMAAVGKFLIEHQKLGLKSTQIFGDETGIGRAMCDAMAEAGCQINRVNNGEKAFDSSRFFNRGSEMWYEATRKIAACEIIIPNDPILKVQLCSRKLVTRSDGRIMAERKEDMAKRAVASPDRADAVCGAICNREIQVQVYNDPLTRAFEPGESWRDRMDEVESSGSRAGFDAGY